MTLINPPIISSKILHTDETYLSSNQFDHTISTEELEANRSWYDSASGSMWSVANSMRNTANSIWNGIYNCTAVAVPMTIIKSIAIIPIFHPLLGTKKICNTFDALRQGIESMVNKPLEDIYCS